MSGFASPSGVTIYTRLETRTDIRLSVNESPQAKVRGRLAVTKQTVSRTVNAWGYSSVGRAMRSQRIGQGFESP